MRIEAPTPGRIRFVWPRATKTLLLMRTGASPGFAHWTIAGDSYEITNLSRRQRYLCGALDADGTVSWKSVVGDSVVEEETRPVQIARIERFSVMPQHERVTLYWQLGRGFISGLELVIRRGDKVLSTERIDRDVRSVVCRAQNGESLSFTLTPLFARLTGASASAMCRAAPQGEERAANAVFRQLPLIYPCLTLGDEQDPFADAASGQTPQRIACGTCQGTVAWDEYLLRCCACRAEYVPNGRGDYLDVAKLRFGTCRCCLPKKVLISEGDDLTCAHSRKQYIRLPGEAAYRLIEDLPFGLCQCCRPRKPLLKRGEQVRCAGSDELHTSSAGEGFILVPSAPIFDAARIDELLDAGLAELSGTGINKRRNA
jgi:hypothetical protein